MKLKIWHEIRYKHPNFSGLPSPDVDEIFYEIDEVECDDVRLRDNALDLYKKPKRKPFRVYNFDKVIKIEIENAG